MEPSLVRVVFHKVAPIYEFDATLIFIHDEPLAPTFPLSIPINENQWDPIVEHCTFDYMKQHATKAVPLGGIFWDGGAQQFIHKGTNGRWRDVLSDEDSQDYERLAREKLGEPCARWLATGE